MFSPRISDLDKRSLALNPGQSFIVEAPAGSGKTSLLVARYLRLLALVNNPEEILAITFTQKAAFEMRSRIIDALKNADQEIQIENQHKNITQKLAQKALQQNQNKQWNITQNPQRLRIQTIDAFCLYLINQALIITELTSKKSIVQNQDADLYYRKAAEAIFENLTDPEYSPYLEQLLLYLNNDWERAANLFTIMLKSREQWLPYIAGLKNTKTLRIKLEQALENIVQENIECCTSLFPQDLYHELTKLLTFSHKNHTEFTENFSSNSSSTKLSNWQKIAELLLTKEFSWRKKVTTEQGFPAPSSINSKPEKELYKSMKNRMEELLNKLSTHEDLRLSLENLLLSPPLEYEDKQWEIIEALIKLLPLLVAHLKVIFNENTLTDHAEISMTASRVLGEQDTPSDLALNLDYQLQHILIDEFQDTSIAQYRLLEKLTNSWGPNEGRTIFIVGDPMQSIYRFREAEVGLFLRAQNEGIGNIKLQPLTLNTNFRSSQNIVNWINTNFTKIFPSFAEINLGAVPFKHATAVVNNPESHVNIDLIPNGDETAEASCVISTIKKISAQNPNDTIAVLVKARSHLTQIIARLRDAQMSYQGFELDTLNENMVVKDLFSLTRALFDLTDRIAWIAILRAPWCGLTLEDLYTIAHGKSQVIWENICDHDKSALSADGQQRLARFKAALLQIFPERGRISWHDLIEKTWLLIGGPATINHEKELEYTEVYFELLSDPLDIEHLQKKLETLYTPHTPSTSKIQLMTIHKAKGLEFDHVIIPSINKTTRHDERKLLLWLERPNLHHGSSLLLAPITANSSNSNKVYTYLHLVEQKKSYYETGRLLYVAMTRAKKSIHITGWIKNAKEINPSPGTFLEQLKPCFNENWILQKNPEVEPVTSKLPLPFKISRFTSGWHLPVTIDIPTRNNKPDFILTDNQASIIGSVIHHSLRQISEDNLVTWDINHIAKQIPYWRKLLQQGGYIEIEKGLKKISEVIALTLKDPKGRWILSPHLEAKSEVTITYHLNNNFTQHIIDRTFIDENGFRWIIDYKTAKVAKEESQNFLQQERIKHSPQLLQYAKIMQSLTPTTSIRLGLYYPLFSGWIEIPYE